MDEKTIEKPASTKGSKTGGETGGGTGSEIQKANSTQPQLVHEYSDRLFDEFFSRHWLSPFRLDWPGKHLFRTSLGTKIPHVDVIDRDDEIVIRSEVPGVDKKDLEVSMTDNSVTIKGSTQQEEKEEKGDYYRHEISHGSFLRTVNLPCDVNSDKTRSSFKDGVLELTVPKAKAVKRHKIKL